MFIDSGFALPVPAFPFPVALVDADPDEQPLVSVCFNRAWLPYVVTCLYQLVLQSTWATDDPDALNLVQARAMTLISQFIQGCKPPSPNPQAGTGGDEEFMLRQNPDNPCELQSSVDGVTWCTWADLSLCKPAVTQPGGGAEQPPTGGGQECYHAIMQAKSQWNVPTIVSAGDQITFSNVQGAGADGGIDGLWYCPNGQTFFAGACVGVPGAKAADIQPNVPHMRLIVNVGGEWFDAYNTSFTVPAGVANSPIIVQINDSDIADNSGSYQFDVCVTNNQVGTWTHTFDLAAGDGGFIPLTIQGNYAGNYVQGAGWQSVLTAYPDPVSRWRQVTIGQGFPSRTITSVQMEFDITLGDHVDGAGNTDNINLKNGAIDNYVFTQDYRTAPTSPVLWSGSQVAQRLEISLIAGINGSATDPGGTATLTKVILTGLGTDPFAA